VKLAIEDAAEAEGANFAPPDGGIIA